jgi:hypothetical protein
MNSKTSLLSYRNKECASISVIRRLRLSLIELISCLIVLVFGIKAYGNASPPPREPMSALPPAPVAEQPAGEVDISFFYDRLSPYGVWFNNSQYGWCWRPNGVPAGWRPYTHGQWIYTDDYGWVWDSDYEWGWAPFHYGRWFLDDEYGWCWVPGYEWGPAWVAWRSGDNFIGWCPLPPDVRWQAGVFVTADGFNFDLIPWNYWSFCENRYFGEPRVWEHCFPVSRNVFELRESKNITRYEFKHGRIFDRSVSPETIGKAWGRKVPRFHVRDVGRLGETYLPRERPDTIDIFRPGVKRKGEILVLPGASELQRQHEAEISTARERNQAESQRLQQRQQRELGMAGANREEMRRRHKEEQNALRGEQERQMRSMERRFQRESESFGHREEEHMGRPSGQEEHGGSEGFRGGGEGGRGGGRH